MVQVELVRVVTSDQLSLDGALQWAVGDSSGLLDLDAMILLHGVGSNFYGSTLMEGMAAALVASGVSALRVNTTPSVRRAAETGPRRSGLRTRRLTMRVWISLPGPTICSTADVARWASWVTAWGLSKRVTRRPSNHIRKSRA